MEYSTVQYSTDPGFLGITVHYSTVQTLGSLVLQCSTVQYSTDPVFPGITVQYSTVQTLASLLLQ
jgi:hypothetical protein